jgi:integrase
MPLNDITIRRAEADGKSTRLYDERGLYLEVAPSGGKWWRLKYRIAGKEKRLSLGVYPDVGLKEARNRRDDYRRLIANGVDPSENRKAVRASRADLARNSFETVAREWLGKYSTSWAKSHEEKIRQRFERDIFPWMGEKPVGEITAPELLAVLRRIEDRGAVDTAHRALGNCGQVFRYAIATGRCTRDTAADLRGALAPIKGTHFAATTEPEKLARILRVLDSYQGTLTVRCALRLAPLVFVRPGELRKAEWSEVDLGKAEWRFVVTKTKTPHIVPLSRQALEILGEIRPLTGRGRFVFPSARSTSRPMSDNAVLAAMRRMGIGADEMSGHGFRAAARTILDEVLAFRADFIEHQLAHEVRDPNGRAYNRTAHLAERKRMMQAWADYLDKLKAGAEVVPIDQSA